MPWRKGTRPELRAGLRLGRGGFRMSGFAIPYATLKARKTGNFPPMPSAGAPTIDLANVCD